MYSLDATAWVVTPTLGMLETCQAQQRAKSLILLKAHTTFVRRPVYPPTRIQRAGKAQPLVDRPVTLATRVMTSTLVSEIHCAAGQLRVILRRVGGIALTIHPYRDIFFQTMIAAACDMQTERA
jgi:hypothetical protein